MMNDTKWHYEVKWCPNCEEDTIQHVKWSGHERDSTHDNAICTVCKWEYNGYTGEYEEPWRGKE